MYNIKYDVKYIKLPQYTWIKTEPMSVKSWGYDKDDDSHWRA